MILDPNNLDQVVFKQFYIAMSNRCNLSCAMCTTTTHPHELEEELSFDAWARIIDNVTRFKVESIGFGGGEPLIRKNDVSRLAKMVASKGIIVNIITNASLLTAEFLDDIIEYKDKIIFLLSLDGLEEENDKIRGVGVFKKVIEAAENLRRYNWEFYFTSVLMPQNFTNYEFFLDFLLKNYPGVYVDIQPIIPHNEIYYKRNKFELSEIQLNALKGIILFLHKNEGQVKLCRPLKLIDKYWDYFTNTIVSENQCKMGTESFNINLRGNLWICGKELRYPLDKYKLEDVFNSPEYISEMKRVQNCKSPCLAGLII